MNLTLTVADLMWLVKRSSAAPAFVDAVAGRPGPRATTYLPETEPKAIVRPKEVLLYLLVRTLKPERAVETGVHHGWSTKAILSAMNENETGRLVSIDLPTVGTGQVDSDGHFDGCHVDRTDDTGREVPAYLRGRWQLRLGSSQDLLPAALKELGSIDLFFHDSEHSSKVMRWEYETAWPFLTPGGVLYSDDVDWNDAFAAFARDVGRPAHTFRLAIGKGKVGGLRK